MCTLNNKGIISNERVKHFGEVFTPDTIVQEMLSLIDNSLTTDIDEYINRTYLEPSCGDGQFLIRILSRKLEKVKELPLEQRELALIKSISSIYGIDIQQDNIIKSQNRMLNIAIGKEVSTFDLKGKVTNIQIELSIDYNEQLIKIIKTILNWNIIVGNTLKSDEVQLKSYNYNEDKIKISKCLLSNLQYEYDSTDYIHYLDLDKINITSYDEEVEDYDF